MSINIHVNGSPISNRKGKIIQKGPKVRDEDEKRRRIRMQQVRQQSDEAAERIRNKVRKVSQEEVSKYEKDSAAKLREINSRKLLEMQNQYSEGIKNIGAAHIQAQINQAEEEVFTNTRNTLNNQRARERASIAKEKHQISKNEQSLQKAVPIQTKRMTREIENARSAMVSQMAKMPKKRRKKDVTNITITNHLSASDSDLQLMDLGSDASLFTDSSNDSTDSNTSLKRKNTRAKSYSPIRADVHREPDDTVRKLSTHKTFYGHSMDSGNKLKPKHTTDIKKAIAKSTIDYDKSNLTHRGEENFSGISHVGINRRRSSSPRGSSQTKHSRLETFDLPNDTRISEHIKNRRLSQAVPLSPVVESGNTSTHCNEDEFTQERIRKKLQELRNKENSHGDNRNSTVQQHTKSTGPNDSTQVRKSTDPADRKLAPPLHANHSTLHKNTTSLIDGAQHIKSRDNMQHQKSIGGNEYSTQYRKSTDQSDGVHRPINYESYPPEKHQENYGPKRTITSKCVCKTKLNEGELNIAGYNCEATKQCPCGAILQNAIAKQILHHQLNYPHPSCIGEKNQYEDKNLKGNYSAFTSTKEFKNNKLHCDCSTKQGYLPCKPTVTLHTSDFPSEESKQYNRVQSYDHDNRYSKTYITDNANVQKIPLENLEFLSSDGSEELHRQQILQRKQAANTRGKKAMEKTKIQKDYQDLMKKLPVLQKRERIAKLDSKKDKYHMSEDRLKDYERKRQHAIESAVEKILPAAASRAQSSSKSKESQQVRILDSNDTDAVNVGVWTNKSEKQVSQESVTNSDIENLKHLLEKLKAQKEILEKENSLPKNSNIISLISKLEESSKHKSTNDTSLGTRLDSPKRKRRANTDSKVSDARSSKSSDYNKQKSKRDILVLQNMSTQTSPKVTQPIKPSEAKVMEQIEKCLCSGNKDDREKLCEILIKIKEHETPQIVICGSENNNDVKIGKESPKKPESTKSRDSKKSREVTKLRESTKQRESSNQINDTNITTDRSDAITVLHAVPKRNAAERRKKSKTRETYSTNSRTPTDSRNVRAPTDSRNTRAPIDSRNVSWKEHFSKNDTTLTNSSTSYYSPPDYNRREPQNNDLLINLLHKKPQQSNVEAAGYKHTQSIDPKLLTYIKKLLLMSKAHVDNLGVSSVSEPPTPGSSIINVEENRPLQNLKSVLKKYSLNIDDVIRQLNASTYQGRPPSSTLDSAQIANQLNEHQGPRFSNVSYDSTHREKTKNESSILSSNLNRHQNIQISNRSNDTTDRNISNTRKDGFSHSDAAQYAQVATNCAARIQQLTEQIEQIRTEQQKMLSPGGHSVCSDKDNATSYLNLPPNESSSRCTTPEQRDLTDKLVHVDLDKGNTANDIEIDENLLKQLTDIAENTEDEDLVARYIALITNKDLSQQKEFSGSHDNNNEFYPVLLDIPKLPKLESGEPNILNLHKKPPPAKGLRIARKFNDNINILPHELSTIPEADSTRKSVSPAKPKPKDSNDKLVGTSPRDTIEELMDKIRSEIDCKLSTNIEIDLNSDGDKNEVQFNSDTSSDKTNEQLSPTKLMERIRTQIGSKNESNKDKSSSEADSDKKQDRSSSKFMSEERMKLQPASTSSSSRDHLKLGSSKLKYSPTQIAEIIKNLQDVSTDSSNEKSEVDLEAVFINMGLGWAAATVRKTQQALARQISSTSLETSSKSSSSDITLKDKCNSNLNKTDVSISVSLQENFENISSINGSNSSVEKQHRTSTPVQTTKSSEKSKSTSTNQGKIFTGESDISSVAEDSKNSNHNSEVNFISIPDCTANDSTVI